MFFLEENLVRRRGKASAWTGFIADESIRSELEAFFEKGDGKTWSPTHFELYNSCPFRFFLERLLGVYPLRIPKEEIETVDECDFKILYTGEVNLEVYQPPTISPLTDVEVCDDDHDGFFEFDLKALKEEEVLKGQDSTVFEVLYFNNLSDAENNENAVGDTYINAQPHVQEELFARIHNIQNPICYEIESFDITVFEIPNPPEVIGLLGQCDSSNYGTDTDGFEYFDLSSKAGEILNGQDPGVFKLTYFVDQGYTNAISTPEKFLNTIKHGQTIYVRITNENGPQCTNDTSFEID